MDLQTQCLKTEIIPALAINDIVIRPYRELSKRERKIADDYFLENVFPILTPQAVDPGHPFPYISNLSLNLGVMVAPPEPKKNGEPALGATAVRFARIKLPPSVPRLIPVGDKGCRFTFLGSREGPEPRHAPAHCDTDDAPQKDFEHSAQPHFHRKSKISAGFN